MLSNASPRLIPSRHLPCCLRSCTWRNVGANWRRVRTNWPMVLRRLVEVPVMAGHELVPGQECLLTPLVRGRSGVGQGSVRASTSAESP
jgi:hypothetical protein